MIIQTTLLHRHLQRIAAVLVVCAGVSAAVPFLIEIAFGFEFFDSLLSRIGIPSFFFFPFAVTMIVLAGVFSVLALLLSLMKMERDIIFIKKELKKYHANR